MRIQRKQINFLLLFSFVLWIVWSQSILVAAEDEKGKLEIKTDRIIQDNSEKRQFGETELDRVFPDLFTEAVSKKLTTQQMAEGDHIAGLKQTLFTKDIPDQTTLYDVKSNIFTKEYTTNFALKKDSVEDDESNQGSSFVFYGTLVSVIGMIFGGVIFLLRNY